MTASDGKSDVDTFFKIVTKGTLLLLNSNKYIGYIGNMPDSFVIDGLLAASSSDNVTVTLTLSDISSGILSTDSLTSVNGVLIITGLLDDVNEAISQITFTKDASFTGQVSISTILEDGINPAFNSNVTIQPNQAPVAAVDIIAGTEESSLLIDTNTLISNDTDQEDVSVIFDSIFSQPLSGATLIDNLDGTFTYAPNADFSGIDTFEYKVVDRFGEDSIAEVRINVSNINDAPTGITLSSNILAENSSGAFIGDLTVVDVDTGDSHTFIVDDTRFEVINGQLKLVDGQSLDFETEPTADVNIIATDLVGESTAPITFTINVSDTNDEPTASDIQATTNETDEDIDFVITVADILTHSLADDADVSDVLSIYSVQNAVNGSVLFDGTSVTFAPDDDYFGSASFEFTVTDGNGGTVTRIFNLNVVAINDKPVVSFVNGAVDEDTQLTITLSDAIDLANEDGSIAPTQTNISIYNVTASATVSVNADGTISYKAADDFNGVDTFEYTITDSQGLESDQQTVSITVNAINDAPTAITLSDNILAENVSGAIIGDLTVADIDAGDSHTFTTTDARFEVVNGQLKLV
ncbi:MAG: tandem-95 repeat protein, partial [Rickettsiales bacterium]|nr:tandem-95 repeat protein [Rickettsiales bacterium]MDG4544527.1 tandem-95 repeat protein [Rickettsiales bacterium]MDG4546649.1 tandem-95 repeat protein [Rickettsiales bacterium]